jgi:polar amino acid transport system permease protein
MLWNWAYVWLLVPALLKALRVTVAATLAGFAVAMVLGLLVAIVRRSGIRPLVLITGGIVTFIRSTPLLVQLYFLFYVLPAFGITMSPLVTGVVGLGLHYSTYLSEVFRAGIEGVRKGQWEAAKALNLSRMQTWVRVILPQAIPPVIPVLGNYLIVMFKETPLLSAITLVEIVQTAKILGSESFSYLEPFTLVGLLFLLLSYPTGLAVRRLEARFK